MPDFSLRPARAEDSDAIHALIKEGDINPTGLDWRRFVLAVDSADSPIGCGQIKPHRDGSQELASIAVTAAWQGRGVARAIIEHLMAGSSGTLYLMCDNELPPFYEKFGFRVLTQDEMPRSFRRTLKVLNPVFRRMGFEVMVMARELDSTVQKR